MPRAYLVPWLVSLALVAGCRAPTHAQPEKPKDFNMRSRSSDPDRAAVTGLPASMFEGTFDDAAPDPAVLRQWGVLAVALMRAGRGDLLEMPVIDDVPFKPLPPEESASADDDQPCCGADPEPGEPETPTFDVIGSVRGVQERLLWLGFFGGPVTNLVDEATRKAIKAFQEESRLPISGYPDQATRDALARRTIW